MKKITYPQWELLAETYSLSLKGIQPLASLADKRSYNSCRRNNWLESSGGHITITDSGFEAAKGILDLREWQERNN
ncbi:hypothetical protein [Paenibacillus pini]